MKIYVAAPFINKVEAAEAKSKFEAAGFDVTSRWIVEDLGLTNEDVGKPEHMGTLQQRAIEDYEDVQAADVFVILNLGKSEGKATELGVAYTLGIPVVLVGPRQGNIFYLLPGVYQAESVDAAVEGIKLVAGLDVIPEGDDETA